mmetsp:Transcript_42773/g.114470  ORF Transcript_42773/g.114470 Transcript_42773/m.114470 type:complete len:218 (+) Transcript_42773:435-1088(+)
MPGFQRRHPTHFAKATVSWESLASAPSPRTSTLGPISSGRSRTAGPPSRAQGSWCRPSRRGTVWWSSVRRRAASWLWCTPPRAAWACTRCRCAVCWAWRRWAWWGRRRRRRGCGTTWTCPTTRSWCGLATPPPSRWESVGPRRRPGGPRDTTSSWTPSRADTSPRGSRAWRPQAGTCSLARPPSRPSATWASRPGPGSSGPARFLNSYQDPGWTCSA